MKPLESDIAVPPKTRVQIIVGDIHLVDFNAPTEAILIYSIIFPEPKQIEEITIDNMLREILE